MYNANLHIEKERKKWREIEREREIKREKESKGKKERKRNVMQTMEEKTQRHPDRRRE